MRFTTLLLLLGIATVGPGATTVADDSDNSGHDTVGPVRPLWEVRYDGSASAGDFPRSLAVSPGGKVVFVTGGTNEINPLNSFTTFAYQTTTGEEIWSARYYGQGLGADAIAVAASPDDTMVFVAGTSDGLDTRIDYDTVAYDAATGVVVWTARYVAALDDVCNALAVSPNGTMVYVTGSSPAPTLTWDQTTVAYDAITGEEIWVARFKQLEVPDRYSGELAVSPDGSTVIVLLTANLFPVGSQFVTVAYDATTGTEMWHAIYGDSETRATAEAIAVSPDSSAVYVTGTSFVEGTGSDYATFAYDSATGETLWSWRYGVGSTNRRNASFAIDTNPDGSTVFVTGASTQPGGRGYGMTTVAIDAVTATEEWVARYDAPTDEGYSDIGGWLAVSPCGSTVWAMGISRTRFTHDDYVTVAYDTSSGEETWAARYDGGEALQDWPSGMTCSPDGANVFVTGTSHRLDTEWDFMTIAYELVLSVDIDVRPGRFPNRVNPRSGNLIPVALIGNDGLDVSDIDVATLRFGPGQAQAIGAVNFTDVNFDGIGDLVARFRARETGLSCGDETAKLSGRFQNRQFIEGTDSINTVGCHPDDRDRGTRRSSGRTMGLARKR